MCHGLGRLHVDLGDIIVKSKVTIVSMLSSCTSRLVLPYLDDKITRDITWQLRGSDQPPGADEPYSKQRELRTL